MRFCKENDRYLCIVLFLEEKAIMCKLQYTDKRNLDSPQRPSSESSHCLSKLQTGLLRMVSRLWVTRSQSNVDHHRVTYSIFLVLVSSWWLQLLGCNYNDSSRVLVYVLVWNNLAFTEHPRNAGNVATHSFFTNTAHSELLLLSYPRELEIRVHYCAMRRTYI